MECNGNIKYTPKKVKKTRKAQNLIFKSFQLTIEKVWRPYL